MTLGEVYTEYTDRQVVLWNLWLTEEANNPGRLESYLMRLCYEVRMLNERVRTMLGKDKMKEYDLKDFKVTFDTPLTKKLPKEKLTALSQQTWMSRLGEGVVHKRISRKEAIARGMIDG